MEAARAGEQGAGFAVVASEVRNLATRSAEAAKDTTVLIQNTLEKIDMETRLLEKTGQTFAATAEKTEHVNLLVDEIQAASNGQASGIEQISTTVGEMDQVVRNNAVSAEETATASEKMNAQMSVMEQLLTRLEAMVNGREQKRTPNFSSARSKTADAIPEDLKTESDRGKFDSPTD